METHLILDPLFKNGSDFLATVAKLLSGQKPNEDTSEWQAKELIKHHLFRKGVDQKKTTILIIDEGQKLPVFCLELLREFLNYETNEYKLLQIVIFAQKEFEEVVRQHPNFADRINLFHRLKPLDLRHTRMMIRFRLEKSGSTPKKLDLFTLPAVFAIYRATGGFPRKIINLCHQCILTMIIQNRPKVRYGTVQHCAGRVFAAEGRSQHHAGVQPVLHLLHRALHAGGGAEPGDRGRGGRVSRAGGAGGEGGHPVGADCDQLWPAGDWGAGGEVGVRAVAGGGA